MAYKPASKNESVEAASPFDGKTPEQIDQLIADAQAAKLAIVENARLALRDKLLAQIAKAGTTLTLREIFREELAPVPRTSSVGSVVGTVYVNPDNPEQTWTSGTKGKHPKWLSTRLASGTPLASLAKSA